MRSNAENNMIGGKLIGSAITKRFCWLFRVKRERREEMWYAEEFGNGRHIRVKFKRTGDVKRGREEIGGL